MFKSHGWGGWGEKVSLSRGTAQTMHLIQSSVSWQQLLALLSTISSRTQPLYRGRPCHSPRQISTTSYYYSCYVQRTLLCFALSSTPAGKTGRNAKGWGSGRVHMHSPEVREGRLHLANTAINRHYCSSALEKWTVRYSS